MSTETTAATTAGTPATSSEDPVEEVSADAFSHARTLDVDHDWYKRAAEGDHLQQRLPSRSVTR